MNEIRKQIIEEARTYIGTPFHHQGRKKGVGVDCVGIPLLIGKKLGLIDFDYEYKAYARHPDGISIKREIIKFCDEIPIEEMQAGDIISFWIDKKKREQHLGIVIEDNKMIHAFDKGGVLLVGRRDKTISKVKEIYIVGNWVKRIHSAYRFKGVE